MTSDTRTHQLVVVSNRLPVDSQVGDDGEVTWVRSPGGLVTALESVTRGTDAAWVGWPGSAGLDLDPFDADGMRLVPVALSDTDFERYYEGFSNATIWPLYHDVIAVPEFHREWWERYVAVNQRFAEAVAEVAAEGATVWVQDYQLQLLPRLLRSMRPDLAIGFFLHIPFPPYGLFSQLPWRSRIIDGLLGADVVGFQRASDAANFATAVRRLTESTVRAQHRGSLVELEDAQSVQREHMLIKVRVDNQSRSHVLEAVNLFRARVVDVVPEALVIEVTGDTGKIQAFLRVLEPFGIKEIAQSGLIAVGRGSKSITERVYKN